MLKSKKTKRWLLIGIITLVSFGGLFLFRSEVLYGDEYQHYQTIKELTNLEINENTFLRDAKFPGYFLVIALLRNITGATSIFETRIVNFLISVFCILIFYLTAKKLSNKTSNIKTVQFFFFPFIFIFFFLIYTDVLSVLLLILSFYFILDKKYLLSAVPAILSIFVRQNNIVWLLFFWLYIFKDYPQNKEAVIEFIKETWIYIIAFIFFLLFILINNGGTVGVGNKTSQPISIHLDNIFFFLLLFFIVFFPLIIANIKKLIFFLKNKYIGLVLLLIFIIYIISFKADHFWNSMVFDYYLRNRFLHFMTKDELTKALFFFPMAISLLYILKMELRNRIKFLFVFFVFFFLSLSWLIEPRYYIIPFTFFLLLKKEESKKIEFAAVVLYLILSTLILIYTVNKVFFI